MATSDKPNYWPHLIILIIATIADVVAIFLAWEMGARLFFVSYFIFLGIIFIWPALALLAGLIYVIIDTRKPINTQEKVFLCWAIILLFSLPFSMVIGNIYNNQARIYHQLPNNDTLTIWQERIIFEKYTSCFAPRTNYIELPSGTFEWMFTIDSMGNSAVLVDRSDEIKQVSPKYPLVGIYEGSPGQYWFYKEFPPEKWMAHIQFNFYPDAFSTGAYLYYTTIANDSVYHVSGGYPFTQYSQYHETFDRVEPLDSFIISAQNLTYHYRFWADSTQYSIFHKDEQPF